MNKGAAEKGAGRPANQPAQPVQTLGMLGAGMMGAGIAYVSARAGMGVMLLDSTQEKAAQGRAYSEKLLAKEVERGRMDQHKAARTLSRIEATTDYHSLLGCDLIVEAVFEDRAIKADVTRKMADAAAETKEKQIKANAEAVKANAEAAKDNAEGTSKAIKAGTGGK